MSHKPDLLFVLHDLARQLRVDADRRAGMHGMTRAQWMILFHLDRGPGQSQKELAEVLEVEPITVARLVDRLEARCMVERRADASDRRIWRLHLTDSARPVLDKLHCERAAMQVMATEGLDPATLENVTDALLLMKANVLAGQRVRSAEKVSA